MMPGPIFQIVVPPSPVPQRVETKVLPMSDGTQAVVLEIHDASGVKYVFLNSAGAKELGDSLLNASREAGSGLITATHVPFGTLG
jgi:hypothetical protein